MRLIHTSDWHLGQTLHGQDRDHEHAQFLAWLLDQLVAHRADALLIAGDVFDTVNPPLKAQERLYDFIVRAHEKLPQLDIVMIAGNHDSGGRIELPAPLMKRLNAHAVGRISWVAEGQLDHQRLLVPLHDALFAETSPGPVKYAASLLGHGTEHCRLPLAPIADTTRARVREAMVGVGLLN